jgi:hypothetical protein
MQESAPIFIALYHEPFAKPRSVPMAPMRDTTMPPANNQIVLSVGAFVNKRENEELIESEALTPYTISMMPTASMQSDINRFIIVGSEAV